ncbi:MAG: ATP-binding protein [Terracidiphilus sp.]|jgi:anti-sigma regulatory factor (Ser/Thr protein kinase)
MPAEDTVRPAHRLTLRSKLGDLALLWPWVEAVSTEHAIPPDARFAIQLCLEEAVSNVVRHGYGGEPGRSVTVDCREERLAGGVRQIAFVVEDEAPPFDPLEPSPVEKAAVPASLGELCPGGQGIRLLHKFAGSLDYERLKDGNRLTIRFAIPG